MSRDIGFEPNEGMPHRSHGRKCPYPDDFGPPNFDQQPYQQPMQPSPYPVNYDYQNYRNDSRNVPYNNDPRNYPAPPYNNNYNPHTPIYVHGSHLEAQNFNPPINYNEPSIRPGYASWFEDPIVRKRFVSNVLSVVGVLLMMVAGMIGVTYIPPVRKYLVDEKNRGTLVIVFILSFILWMVTYVIIVCCSSLRRVFPCNILMLLLNVLCLGTYAALSVLFIEITLVLLAAIITTGLVFIVAVIARFTTFDATRTNFICLVCILSIVVSLILLILHFIFPFITILNTLLLTVCIVLFLIYLLIDIQLLLGGRENELSPNDITLAVLLIFTDIIHLFLTILALLRGANGN
uniref:Protein lifeguard 1 n=1 Tax=Parastrongyloides trichosuri TaxID=131310 RepID=A0A0N4ZF15_PARTI